MLAMLKKTLIQLKYISECLKNNIRKLITIYKKSRYWLKKVKIKGIELDVIPLIYTVVIKAIFIHKHILIYPKIIWVIYSLNLNYFNIHVVFCKKSSIVN